MSEAAPLGRFHPIVRRWFEETLGNPSAPQRKGWPAIARGGHTLILAPTGSGKTLAAFLWELNALISDGLSAPLPDTTRIVYVSPLKALGNDIHRNLETPLAELRTRFEAEGIKFPEIRVAVRSGDTPASARARMRRRAPHILITTPESLHILLTSERARGMFADVRAVIVDEIHAVAGTKRGAHLALTLERLEELVVRLRAEIGEPRSAPQRIGLSATQRPLEEIARFLGGCEVGAGAGGVASAGGRVGSGVGEERVGAGRGPSVRGHASEGGGKGGDAVGDGDSAAARKRGRGGPPPTTSIAPMPNSSIIISPPSGADQRQEPPAPAFRDVTIVDCGLVKSLDLSIASPLAREERGAGVTVWHKVTDILHELSRKAKTMLVFVNNRSLAERISNRLNDQAEQEIAQPYHGSLSRERRQALEQRLKAGDLKVIIATSSLELGIDIGSVDLVVQLQSPKRVSAALQRVGRAGHQLEAVSRGVFVATYRDDLVEIAALVDGMLEGDVEPTTVPQNPLDVLSQILVATASVDDCTSDGLFSLARRAYPFHRLSRQVFDAVLEMLAAATAGEMGAELVPRIDWDRVSGRVSAPRRSRMLAVTSGGTIPDRGLYAVLLPDRTRLGELDEEFVHESRVGDVFQLGSSTWRILSIERDRVIVRPAPGAPARMPFWRGEFLARSPELAPRIGAVRRAAAAERSTASESELDKLATRVGADAESVRMLREYVAEQLASTGVIPDEKTIVVERFPDEMGGIRIVVHSAFGGRINAPWGLALGSIMRELTGSEVQVQTSDEGVMLRIPDIAPGVSFEPLEHLTSNDAEKRIIESVRESALFGARFRMNAARALLLPRERPGKRMPLWLQRLRAADLLDAVRDVPDFPILVETYREILRDAFDIAGVRMVLDGIAAGRIRMRFVETDRPSPFAAGLMFGFVMEWLYSDDTPRAERSAARLAVDRGLLDEVMGEEPDDEFFGAIEEVLAARRGSAPKRRARSADELAEMMHRSGDLGEVEIRDRVAEPAQWRRGDPLQELLESRRALLVRIPLGEEEDQRIATGSKIAQEGAPAARDKAPSIDEQHQNVAGRGKIAQERAPAARANTVPTSEHHPRISWRYIPAEFYSRYVAAFGRDLLARVRTGYPLAELDARDALPAQLIDSPVRQESARREILARWLALAGPVDLDQITLRYDLPVEWTTARLAEWVRRGRLVRGRFVPGKAGAQWLARSVAEVARRRALANLRRQIQPVELPVFASFLQRWQYLDPRERLSGAAGLERVVMQLAGLSRPPHAWERDILPARVARYDPGWLSSLVSGGTVAWSGVPGRKPSESPATSTLRGIRFFRRGQGALWIADDESPPLSEPARRVRDALAAEGASFISEIQAVTGLSGVLVRDALRELVALGLATNDTMDALREVIRTRPLPAREADPEDAARWIPGSWVPTSGQHTTRRRGRVRRLPRWRRPDAAGPASGWVGRWSLVRRRGTLGERNAPDEHAAMIAERWLERYGIVTRDWYRRERPPVAWREIYRHLTRMELRGKVRRGYFVRGLAGSQFALPEAVERLRGAAQEDPDAPFIVMAANDPANPYSLDLPGRVPDAVSRPRGSGALLVTQRGVPLISAESRGRRLTIADSLSDADATAAVQALVQHLHASDVVARRRRDVVIELVNGAPAARSSRADAIRAAGFRLSSEHLRWYAPI